MDGMYLSREEICRTPGKMMRSIRRRGYGRETDMEYVQDRLVNGSVRGIAPPRRLRSVKGGYGDLGSSIKVEGGW